MSSEHMHAAQYKMFTREIKNNKNKTMRKRTAETGLEEWQ